MFNGGTRKRLLSSGHLTGVQPYPLMSPLLHSPHSPHSSHTPHTSLTTHPPPHSTHTSHSHTHTPHTSHSPPAKQIKLETVGKDSGPVPGHYLPPTDPLSSFHQYFWPRPPTCSPYHLLWSRSLPHTEPVSQEPLIDLIFNNNNRDKHVGIQGHRQRQNSFMDGPFFR